MDALTFIGNGIFFTIGTIFGAALIYFGGLIIDNIEDHTRN